MSDSRTNVDDGRWAAKLDLHFDVRGDRTALSHVAHFGPLRVQRPFYPEENGTPHVYLLHPPGGVVGGDILEVCVEAGEGSRALVTTPAATKLYRSAGPLCTIRQSISVRDAALLEWLPQETIVFSGAHAQVETIVQLEDEGEFIGWELVCLGRPASGDTFEKGSLVQRWEVWRGDKPLLVERLVLDAESLLRSAPWGLDGKCALATMVVSSKEPGLVESIRQVLSEVPPEAGLFACSALEEVTTVRYVGASVPEAWAGFVRVWEMLRPVLSGRSAAHPRIWKC